MFVQKRDAKRNVRPDRDFWVPRWGALNSYLYACPIILLNYRLSADLRVAVRSGRQGYRHHWAIQMVEQCFNFECDSRSRTSCFSLAVMQDRCMAKKKKRTAAGKKSALTAQAEAAFEQVARRVIERARRTQTPVVLWRDGHIELVPYERHPLL